MTTEIGVRELRNDVSEILRRVEAGDEFVVTVHGRPVARVVPLDGRPRTMPTEVFLQAISKIGADPELLDELRDAMPDTTDDINPWSD